MWLWRGIPAAPKPTRDTSGLKVQRCWTGSPRARAIALGFPPHQTDIAGIRRNFRRLRLPQARPLRISGLYRTHNRLESQKNPQKARRSATRVYLQQPMRQVERLARGVAYEIVQQPAVHT